MTSAINYMLAELTATCDSLCYNDGNNVLIDKNTIEAIKDLIRYLRRDDDTHIIRRYLGQTKILQKDLIKIFVLHSNKTELWNVLLRLLINLTSPALMIYNEELPTDKIIRSNYLEILSHLQEYKSAMTNDALWSIVQQKLKDILEIDSAERGEENETILERILTLIRNVLRVPASDSENRTDNDATIHDALLFALNTSGISDILVYMASSSAEQQYHLQILEIVAFMLQGQNPARLAKAEMQRSDAEKQADEIKLLNIRQKEMSEKAEKMKKYAGSRHSRFGGTFIVQNMKAIGDNEMICHKPYKKIEDLDFSVTKQKTKKRRLRNGVVISGSEDRVSALSVRLFLKEFCVEFLNGAYNPVMRYARSYIAASTSSNTDASHYLWALRFFMNFNRHYKFQVKYVSETISTEVFYLVQKQIQFNYEMITNDKKKLSHWSTRLHLGINAYQELLYTLIDMDRSEDVGVKNSSRVIMSNIFYVPEYRDTILYQLLNYNELTMSRDYLTDLVTTTHVFLKMLKNFCDKQRHIVVRKPKRKKAKKKTKSASATAAVAAAEPPRSCEDRWYDMGPDVSAVLQHNEIPEVTPFDATIDTPIDEQKGDAMKRIQKLLRCKEYEQAIGILRSAREVWPENDSFGKANMLPEEEFLVLREIFLADLGVPDYVPAKSSQTQGNQIENLLNHDEESDEEEDEEMEQPQFEETNFNFMDFLQRFVNMRIIKNLSILFQQFDKNTIEVNHYILKMYHRIAVECKMPAMLYQASIFRVFQKIFQSGNPLYKDLDKFGRFIFANFAKVAMKNPKAYMELLFWKSTKEAIEMTDGYDTEHTSNSKKSRNTWTDVEEDELRTLFMEHQTNKYSQDLIDFIQCSLINPDRTRRAIIKKLKEMCLIVNSRNVRSEVQKRLPKEWSEDEIAQLTELWEKVQEDEDPVGLIYDSLRIKRSKPKIKEKLLELNLATDPKQLRKKRTKKSDGPRAAWDKSEDEDDSNSDSNEDEENSTSDQDAGSSSSRKKKRKEKKKKKESSGRRKSKQPTIVYTDAQLSGLLKDVIEKGMKPALEWLKESLADSLEDRDEENLEDEALVPLTAETSESIDSPSFRRLLRAIGIQAPDLEEAYWRIPASMLESTIRKRCESIEAALRGEFVEEVVEEKRKDDSESDDDAFFDRLRNYARRNEEDEAAASNSQKSGANKSTAEDAIENPSSPASDKENRNTENENVSSAPTENAQQEVISSNAEMEEEAGFTQFSAKKEKGKISTKRIKTMVDSSDSDDEPEKDNDPESTKEISQDTPGKTNSLIKSDSEDEKMETESQKESDMQSKVSSRRGSAKSSRIRKVLDSDSEEEAEKVSQDVEVPGESKRNISDSDSETPINKKRRLLDSDEEDNATPEAEKSMEKKHLRLLSDDED